MRKKAESKYIIVSIKKDESPRILPVIQSHVESFVFYFLYMFTIKNDIRINKQFYMVIIGSMQAYIWGKGLFSLKVLVQGMWNASMQS